MAFQEAPQIVEVTLNARQDGVPVVNRWNVDVQHAVEHGDLTGLLTVFDGWVTTSLSTNQIDSIFYDTLVAKDMSVVNGEEIIMPVTTTQGIGTSPPAPNNAAVVASLRTSLSGKSFRGRTYMGGLGTNILQDSTHITEAFALTVAGIYTDLIDALETATYVLVVLSRYANKTLRVIALATEIVSVIVDTKIDSQRRRTAN